ncbi:T9SS type A sorting domain-containing protein [Hymenobacter taeanensis]|uniref:T9SS type A sorting domain-containing protein n=1 Tax=Hymenobacter taeanensis TaxID=2735321 RepID=A0A6M6BG72_9BACT|nr:MULTISPECIES: PQQ-dependent sugar dehydrogenase [Hymenobacter]QJX46233.1 T9SS type A sorting domain-containing protein [Hymenobacter taeanensis]UOQ80087.1 PQQ-dependent sugar dehydrogenase [Hymenobacter sp. 5414T-23]
MKTLYAVCITGLVVTSAAVVGRAQTLPVLTTFPVGTTTVTVSALSTGLEVPWELLWGPDNFIWMTERGGRISRVNPNTGAVTPLITLSDVVTSSEGGLLGMVLHPDFSTSPYVYVVYNYNDNGYKEKLVRLTYANGTLGSPVVLLGGILAVSTHSGSRLLILPDRTLLMTTGDAQDRPTAQDRASLNGKVLRLNLDGTIPADNPVAGNASYTFGHRNPQGLVRAANGILYSSEHGQDAEDEVNIIEPNRNYGWPTVEGLCNLPAEQAYCSANNVREPIFTWAPTVGVAALTYYNHPAIPGWRNSLLAATLRGSKLTQIPLNTAGTAAAGEGVFSLTSFGRLRAICVSPQGRVYVGTSNRDGRGTPAPTDDRILVLENLAYVPTPTTAARQEMLGLWPNPARGSVTLRLPAPATATLPTELRDALGRVVLSSRFAVGQSSLAMSVAGLRPGLYSASVLTPTGSYTQRLVVE